MSDSTTDGSLQDLDSSFLDVQFAQAMEMYRSNTTLTVQIFTVLVVADVTLLGFGFEQRNAMLLFLTGFLPIAGLFAYFRISRGLKPVMYSTLLLERRFKLPAGDLMATTMFGMELSSDAYERIMSIADDEDFNRRMDRLSQLRLGRDRRRVQGVGRTLIVFAALLQFVGAIILSQFPGWKWFG